MARKGIGGTMKAIRTNMDYDEDAFLIPTVFCDEDLGNSSSASYERRSLQSTPASKDSFSKAYSGFNLGDTVSGINGYSGFNLGNTVSGINGYSGFKLGDTVSRTNGYSAFKLEDTVSGINGRGLSYENYQKAMLREGDDGRLWYENNQRFVVECQAGLPAVDVKIMSGGLREETRGKHSDPDFLPPRP